MAKENNEINDIVKKCKILLLDIEGTTTSISFVKDKLFPYVEENVKSFLESHWENEDVKEAAAALRKQAAEDQEKSVEGLVAIPGEDASKEEQIDGLVKNVKWQMSADRKAGPLKQLQGLIWKLGYDNGDIQGHVYDDVSPALELWRSTEGQKVYIYSSGSVQAQKLLFNKSLAGDMLPLIEGHFDTAVGAKQEAASYAAIVEQIGCKAEEVLFLTDIVKEAEAARASGLHAALVSREGNAPLPSEAAIFPVLHSFEQLTLTNKRKPDPQVEEVPAKVPKTDAQDDVKTITETEAKIAKTNGATADTRETTDVMKAEVPETMEVEETPDIAVEATPVIVVEEAKVAVEINKAVVETNTATAEVAHIIEKDIPMDDAVSNVTAVTDLKAAIETAVVKAYSTENTEVKVDTVNNLTTVELATGKEDSSEGMVVKALSTEVGNSAAEEKVEISQVVESKVKKAVIKTVDKKKTKVKMIDAATLTENDIVAPPKVKVDVATETATMEDTDETNSEEAFVKPPTRTIGTPIDATTEAPASEPTSEETSKDAMHAPATDSKDMETVPSTQNMEASSTSDVVELNQIEADTTASKIEETTTTDLKIVEATIITDAEVTETSDTLEAVDPPMDEFQVSVVTEPLQNGGAKAAAKPEEIAIESVVDEVIDQKDAHDTPACEIEPVVEEIEERTEPIETVKMETEATVSVEKVEIVTEPKEPAENIQEDAVKESALTTIEVKDITDDKESLVEVTDIIDDVVPLVEEPSNLEEMEKLQNAGDVLEKECDEILSKVQDVTNLDFIPVKSLHTIDEEMETDNMDTNDIVENILDSEMELSMKPEDIDLNTVQEIAESKTDTDDRIGKVEPGTEKHETTEVEDKANEKMEVSRDTEVVAEEPNKNKVEPEIDNGNAKESLLVPAVEKMETEDVVESVTKIESEEKVETEESSNQDESKTDTDVPKVVEPPIQTDATEAKLEDKESDKASVAVAEKSTESSGSPGVKIDEARETKVNGKTNGNAILKQNGDSSKDDDLESRLTADTIKEKVNGSNGDPIDAESVQGDNKVEAETSDIKVKTVATEEVHTTKEQPVEA